MMVMMRSLWFFNINCLFLFGKTIISCFCVITRLVELSVRKISCEKKRSCKTYYTFFFFYIRVNFIRIAG